MKRHLLLAMGLLCFCYFLTAPSKVQAQLLNRIKNEVKNRAANNVIRRAGRATDKAIDQTAREAGRAKNSQPTGGVSVNEGNRTPGPVTESKSPVVTNYKSYDFVPGDKIIFQPDLSEEPDAELPARFTIKKGNAEIQSYEGEKILHLNKGGYLIVTPLMDNDHYLPEQFTLEFDMMYENTRTDYFDQVNDFNIYLYKSDDNNYEGYGLARFTIHSNTQTILGDSKASASNVNEETKTALNTNGVWHHIAIYIRKNIAKAYIGATRVQATNNFPTGATKLAIRTDGRYGFKIKNFRLAAGGDDKYNKIVTEGKFITHGILFDVNKSTIKPESMGALNEIVKLMKAHDELKFEINGHTDSDGNADANKKLSEERANAVKDQLVEMGISSDRLTTKGNGAAKPIDSNDTQEGKANNRRVEFVKI